jgi:predicted Rossmann-fold nucleotide-binding protein
MKETMLTHGMIVQEDLDLLHVVDEPEEVVQYIRKFVII